MCTEPADYPILIYSTDYREEETTGPSVCMNYNQKGIKGYDSDMSLFQEGTNTTDFSFMAKSSLWSELQLYATLAKSLATFLFYRISLDSVSQFLADWPTKHGDNANATLADTMIKFADEKHHYMLTHIIKINTSPI